MSEEMQHEHNSEYCAECGRMARERVEKVVTGIERAMGEWQADSRRYGMSPADKEVLRGMSLALAIAKIYAY